MTRQNTQPNSNSHAPALRCVLNVPATTRLLVAALLVAAAGHIQAAVFNVANNGVDSTACGTAQSPCRSISQAITNAAAGDEILVGPGRYGDLNGNGAMAEPGEETGVSGCSCMIAVNKAVIIRSTHGALATLLDSRTLFVNQNVLISADGAEFGRPGQGFTITPTMANALPFPWALKSTPTTQPRAETRSWAPSRTKA